MLDRVAQRGCGEIPGILDQLVLRLVLALLLAVSASIAPVRLVAAAARRGFRARVTLVTVLARR